VIIPGALYGVPVTPREGLPMYPHFSRLGRAGQGLAEYAIILALIAIAAVFVLMFISGNLDKLLSTIGTKL
jgi:Flp pilus assembly pilin Flp